MQRSSLRRRMQRSCWQRLSARPQLQQGSSAQYGSPSLMPFTIMSSSSSPSLSVLLLVRKFSSLPASAMTRRHHVVTRNRFSNPAFHTTVILGAGSKSFTTTTSTSTTTTTTSTTTDTTTTTTSILLPPPSWSIADLKLTGSSSRSHEKDNSNEVDDDRGEDFMLSIAQIERLCRLAHLDLHDSKSGGGWAYLHNSKSGGGGGGDDGSKGGGVWWSTSSSSSVSSGLTTADVQRDVGKILACTRTMQKVKRTEGCDRLDIYDLGYPEAAEGGQNGDQGGQMWEAPMAEDVVSEVGDAAVITASAARKQGAMFTVPHVFDGVGAR